MITVMEQYKDKDWLEEMYLEKENSTLSIAKIFDIHPELIRRQLVKFNIKVRSYDESKATKRYKKRRRELSRGKNNYFWGKSFSETHPEGTTQEMCGRIPWNRGIPHTEETRKKIGKANTGEKNGNWKGGLVEKYKKWRKSIYKRDDYTCVRCLERGGYLNAHHIILWKLAKDERYELNNGATLCKSCHTYIHKVELR